MIPKIIHYCWFGRNPLPKSAQKCIASWRKFLPDYEIKEWNEDNFDVNIIQYTKEAYQAKKYAFVSDYARFWILYHYGGLYFDTDVEVIKPMDDIIERGSFMGIEIPSKKGSLPLVNPGLGIGAISGMPFYKEMLDKYSTFHFILSDGTLWQNTVVEHTTNILKLHSLQPSNEIQKIENIWIYPIDYFNPFNDLTGKLKITENTHSIHWYSKTWIRQSSLRLWLSRMSHRLFGMALHNTLETIKKRV